MQIQEFSPQPTSSFPLTPEEDPTTAIESPSPARPVPLEADDFQLVERCGSNPPMASGASLRSKDAPTPNWSATNRFGPLAALAAVPTGGECPVPAQFVTAGLTVLAEAAQGEGATRSELVALVLGRAAAARRCGLDEGVEQRLSLLQG